MNFFSGTPFLETFGACFFPDQQRQIALFVVEDAVYRLLVVNGRPIVRWSFLDLLEPLEEVPAGARPRPLAYLPRVVKGVVTVDTWRAMPNAGGDICPLVDWSGFAGWDDYEAAGTRCGRNPESRRRRRALEREIGPLEFTIDTAGPEALAQAIAWKSAQYQATGQPDVFRDPRHARFYAELLRRGVIQISSLTAGGRRVAVHVSVHDRDRRRIWLSAYDGTLSRFAPGRLLQEALLEHSCRSGELECDMLLGAEPFKFAYATHVRICGPAGKEPLVARFERMARPRIKLALKDRPRIQACMRHLRHYLSDR